MSYDIKGEKYSSINLTSCFLVTLSWNVFKTLTVISFEISFLFGFPLSRVITEALFAESGKIFSSTLLFIATVRSGIEKSAQVLVESCLFLRLDLYQEGFNF